MEAIYQLRITLKGIRPPIWRQVQVPADFCLDDLHVLIQVVMGWRDSHLHEFAVEHPRSQDERTFMPAIAADEFEFAEDESRTAVGELLIAVNDKMAYVYDFGDDWVHEVKVQKILTAAPGDSYPRCIKGKRACPPEDCGGPWRYEGLLESLGDSDDEEHDQMLAWVGEEFDSEKFDLAEVKARMRRVGW